MNPILILTGPTGSGKTALASQAAHRLNAEIVCADSRQLYRGMEIGTAQPSASERVLAPHHLYGEFSPRERLSAGAYRHAALRIMANIRERGRTPLLVGGTGFYLRAVMGNIPLAPPTDPFITERVSAEVDRLGPQRAWELLMSIDEQSARRIHPNDRYRLVRSIALFRQTGRPVSSFRRPAQPQFAGRWVALNLDRRELYSRIDERCRAMFAAGFAAEARRLRAAGLSDAPSVRKAIGYRHVFDMLDGLLGEPEAVSLTARDTRRYAKRQLTWLRAQLGLGWVDSEEPETALESVVAAFDPDCRNIPTGDKESGTGLPR